MRMAKIIRALSNGHVQKKKIKKKEKNGKQTQALLGAKKVNYEVMKSLKTPYSPGPSIVIKGIIKLPTSGDSKAMHWLEGGVEAKRCLL